MVDHTQHSSGYSLTTKLALGGALVAGGIIAAPYLLPAIGLGDADVAKGALFILHNAKQGDGLAGAIAGAWSKLPIIGATLAEGGWANIAATSLTGIGGVLLGNWVSKQHEGKEGMDWGKAIKWAALATSALIALPSVLTGITNGLLYLAQEFLPYSAQQAVLDTTTQTIGYTAYPSIFKSGTEGIAASLPHLLTCGFSLAPLMANFGVDAALSHPTPQATDYVAVNTKGEPLPEEDKNHSISKEEQALVARYNVATPAQKILLKKQIIAQGYDPDFHADGTIHLYKHTMPATHAHTR